MKPLLNLTICTEHKPDAPLPYHAWVKERPDMFCWSLNDDAVERLRDSAHRELIGWTVKEGPK